MTAIYFNIFSSKMTSKLPTYVVTAAVGAQFPVVNAIDFVGSLLEPGGSASAETFAGVTPAILEAATIATGWPYADSL